MLSRPEEIHTGSPVRPAFRRPTKTAIGITHCRLWLDRNDRFIVHLYHDRLSAIGARSVYTYRSSWK